MIGRGIVLIGTLALGVLLTAVSAEAQQAGKVYRIGWIGNTPPRTPDIAKIHEAFLQELRDHGYVEGQNLVLERRYSEGREERNAGFAAEFVQMKVDLIVAANSAGAHAAKRATSTIPIVMANVANPEQQGLVASLARPGGNLTGMSSQAAEVGGQLLQLLKDAVPSARRVAILWNPDNPGSALSLSQADEPAAKALGMTPIPVGVRGPVDLERALDVALRERAEALYPHQAMFPYRARILEFAEKNRLPVVVLAREWAPSGALMTYGASLADVFRRAGTYVVKILKGAKPADLPVEQPTKFELVVNMKTAKALGLTIPPSVLMRADQVIE